MSWVHQVPPKPPAKGQTRAEGFRLETGFRAVERTEFDKYVRTFHYFLLSLVSPKLLVFSGVLFINILLKPYIGC